MTVVPLGDGRLRGLSTDTKPTTYPAGTIFEETNTMIDYEYNGSQWIPAQGTALDTFPNSFNIDTDDTPFRNGILKCQYRGVNPQNGSDEGRVGVRVPGSPTGGFSRVLFEYPYSNANTGTGTSASLVTSEGRYYADFDLTFSVRTVAKKKTVSPNSWEAAWLMIRYNEADGELYHHYALVFKTNGNFQFSKKDNTIQSDEEAFYNTEPSYTYALNTWNKVRVRAIGNTFNVWIDDVLELTVTDDGTNWDFSQAPNTPTTPSDKLYSGKIGFYNEDAEVEFSPMTITDLSSAAINPSVSDAGFELQANKNTNNGYVGLDASGRIVSRTLLTGMVSGLKVAAVTNINTDSPVTLTTADALRFANCASGAITYNLPTASGNAGVCYYFKKIDTSTNFCIIDGNGSQTIEGNLTWELRHPNDEVLIVSDGSNWRVLGGEVFSYQRFRKEGATADRRNPASLIAGDAAGTFGMTQDILYALPFIVAKTDTFDLLSIRCMTAGAGSSCRAGIYKDLGNIYPGALIVDSGALDTTTTGWKDASINITLQPGLYWLVVVCSATAPTLTSQLNQQSFPIFGLSNSASATTQGLGYSVAFTFAALPATYPGSATVLTGAVPAVTVRAA